MLGLLIIPLFTFSQTETYDTTNLIVRFNLKLLNWNIVDNPNIQSANIKDLLNSEGLIQLNSIVDPQLNFGSIRAHKIFPMLRTSDSISVSRHGEFVSIPPFWATFKLDVPNDVNYFDFIRIVYDLYPLVIYSHPNFNIRFQAAPNDSLLQTQLSIWDNGSGAAHININGAWTQETGRNFIKVGVFDTGIDTSHVDLDVLTGWAAHQNSTIGSNNAILIEHWGEDWGNHGTKVAGIIGARRNNDSTGIAGIAGGDGSDTTGVQLIDMRFSLQNEVDIASIEEFCTLIMDASRAPMTYFDWGPEIDPYPEYEHHYSYAPGYGIHLGNHSYSFRLGHPAKNEDDPSGGGIPGGYFENCDLCTESMLFSLRNGVINITSSGNKIVETGIYPWSYNAPEQYPAAYDDSWGIRVGASDFNGEVLSGSSDNWFSIWADNVDLIAPGQDALVQTTWSLNNIVKNPNLDLYGYFDGTSAAAPHVTGVAALLLSHYNKPCYSNINLDLSDIEYILQKSAIPTSYNSTGQHSYGAGWGRLDASSAMNMIDFPEFQIVHPNDTFINRQTISIDTIVVYYNKPLNQIYVQGVPDGSFGPLSAPWPLQNYRPYKVVRYKEQLTYDFNQYIQGSTELLDTWVRHSQTNSLGFYRDTTSVEDTIQGVPYVTIVADNFGVEPMAYIDTVINDSIIKLSGYYYHFISKFDNEDLQLVNMVPQLAEDHWYPINPFNSTPRMAYSIYIRDTTAFERFDFPCDSMNYLIDSVASNNILDLEKDILVYPNPASTTLNVKLFTNLKEGGALQLFDISGRLIDEKPILGSENYHFDISKLQSGLYLVNLKVGGVDVRTIKWIKQ